MCLGKEDSERFNPSQLALLHSASPRLALLFLVIAWVVLFVLLLPFGTSLSLELGCRGVIQSEIVVAVTMAVTVTITATITVTCNQQQRKEQNSDKQQQQHLLRCGCWRAPSRHRSVRPNIRPQKIPQGLTSLLSLKTHDSTHLHLNNFTKTSNFTKTRASN